MNPAIASARLLGFATRRGLALPLSLFLVYSCAPLNLENSNDPGSRTNLYLQAINCILKNPYCSAGRAGGSGTNAEIAPTFRYAGSPYTFTLNLPISTITPDVTGTITTCSSNPSLPSGLVLGNENCVISGTPTVNQSPTSYEIKASNAIGNSKETINITVSQTTYTIGGTLTGLTAPGLVLQNNSGDDLAVSSGASTFTFSSSIASGANYSVTVQTQPPGLYCSITNGNGTANANITSIALACVFAITRNWGTFVDNNDGTVKLMGNAGTFGGQVYTAETLTWMKCIHGQVWNSGTNDCTGTGSGPTYGAITTPYCSIADESCNDVGTKLLNGTGTSGAWSACESLNTANAGAGTNGKTNWRVPTKNEFKLLIACTNTTVISNDLGTCPGGSPNPAINSFFPNTISSTYWSALTYVGNTNLAWYVQFTTGAQVSYNTKSNGLYVRCVSGQ
ncbi:DUF1566 domain-containing protein [Leptospira ognonensis]|nr:DUF1566 domain-containing protein [Leptospira ognonensis]